MEGGCSMHISERAVCCDGVFVYLILNYMKETKIVQNGADILKPLKNILLTSLMIFNGFFMVTKHSSKNDNLDRIIMNKFHSFMCILLHVVMQTAFKSQ